MRTNADVDFWRPVPKGNPGWMMDDLQRSVSRIFEHAFDELISPEMTPLSLYPKYELEESDSDYLLNLDVPGVAKEDLNIEVIGNTLLVSGERKEEHSDKNRKRRATETRYGYFERTFTLPQIVNGDKIEAACENGVLKVQIPKADGAKSKQIKLNDGKDSYRQSGGRSHEKEAQRISVQ